MVTGMDQHGVNEQESMSVEDVRGWYGAKVDEASGREAVIGRLRPRVRRVGVVLAALDKAERTVADANDEISSAIDAGKVVLRWDVEDGGVLGAIIVCTECHGRRHVTEAGQGMSLPCPACDATGELHRPHDFERYKESLRATPTEDDPPGPYWVALCKDCDDMEMPFQTVLAREEWVGEHAATGHTIVLGRSWRAGEFEPELDETSQPKVAVLGAGGGLPISRLMVQRLDEELRPVGDPVDWPGAKVVEVSIDLCGNGEWEPGGRHSAEERRCPDDGACHHECATGPCWRVFNAGPLGMAEYVDDLWPGEVRIEQFRRAAEQPAPMLVPDRYHPEVGSTWENCYGKPYRWVEVVGIIQPDPDVGHAVEVRDVVDAGQPENRWVERLDKFLAEWIDCGKPEEGCTAEAEWLTDRPMFTEEMIANAQQDVPFWPNPIRWARHEILVWRIAFNPDLPHDGAVAGKLVVGTCRQGGGSPVVDDAVAGDGGVGVAIRRRQPGDRGLLVPNYDAEPANALVLGWKVDGLAPLWLSPNRAKQVWLARLYHSRFGGWLSRREFGDAGVKECVRPPCPPVVEQEIHGMTTVVEWHDELADWPPAPAEEEQPPTFVEWLESQDGIEPTSQQLALAEAIDAGQTVMGGRGGGKTWIRARFIEYVNEVDPWADREVQRRAAKGGITKAGSIALVGEGRHEVGYRQTDEEEALYRRTSQEGHTAGWPLVRDPKPGEIGGVQIHTDGSIEGHISLKDRSPYGADAVASRLKGVATNRDAFGIDLSGGPRRPEYVYVASSWRNEMQPAVVHLLRAAGIDCYDFRDPHGDGRGGFSWKDVRDEPRSDGPVAAKGTDWVPAEEYLRMIEHPAALDGFANDLAAMERADTFVLVLPCGKSAHLEAGWAMGAGKRVVILLEDPVEPELMYRTAYEAGGTIVADTMALLAALGVED